MRAIGLGVVRRIRPFGCCKDMAMADNITCSGVGRRGREGGYIIPPPRLSSTSSSSSSSPSTAPKTPATPPFAPEVSIDPATILGSHHGVPVPTYDQLKLLFITSAVPFIGFGFMDNMVMLLAGDLIDNTIGLRFGLATLTAAACGQVVSDTCGVCFGGTVEALASKLGLPYSDLSNKQHTLKIVKLVRTAGSALGVMVGCCLGMLSLLFIDTTSKERERKRRELDTIFTTIIDHGHAIVGAERGSLFFVDEQKKELWSRVATDKDGRLRAGKLITVPLDKGIVGEAVRTKQMINVHDVSKDERFYNAVDKTMSSTTRNLIAIPVLSRDGKVIAVIEMMNKLHDQDFSDGDVRLCQMLAHHVAVFLQTVESETYS